MVISFQPYNMLQSPNPKYQPKIHYNLEYQYPYFLLNIQGLQTKMFLFVVEYKNKIPSVPLTLWLADCNYYAVPKSHNFILSCSSINILCGLISL